ncbi:hypothetical protein BDR06DRAFT_897896, partial [Suillus hirtellus]
FVPTENISCSCGELRQTREHILCKCPLFTRQCIHLREVSRHLISSEIMGTERGNIALVIFLEEFDAFKKRGWRNDEEDIEGIIEE